MRIVQTSILSPWDPRHGGGQLSVHDLSTALAARGHDVDVIYSGSGDTAPGELAYRAHFVPHHERLYLNPLEYRRAVKGLPGTIDVLHSHGYEGALLTGAVANGALRVATSRHPDPPDLTSPPSWTHPWRRLRWAYRHISELLERRALAKSDLVLCVSEFSERVLRQRYGLSPEHASAVAHNGGRPLPESPSTEDEIDLLCVARLDRHKGLDVLFEALALLENKGVTLDLVGDGWIEEELKATARSLGLTARVRFHGYLPPGRVRALHRVARVLVLPSRSENFPRVILDALHAGNAIVATKVGGIPEAVRHEREALLVPAGDPEALAEAVDRLLGDEELATRLRKAARARARDFTWDRAAKRTEAAYLEARNG